MSSNPANDTAPCPYPDYQGQGYEPDDVPATGEDTDGLERAVWDALYAVEDPEMPISVVDLGLVYGVTVEAKQVDVDFTLTYTGCPARRMLLDEVQAAATSPEEVEDATVRLVWSPPWTVEMVTERGREQLREFGLSV